MLPADLTSPLLLRLLDYWSGCRLPDGRLPPRSMVDPLALPAGTLPWLLYIELHPGDPVRYRYRVAGTGVVELFGYDPTGRFIDTLGDTPEIRLAIARMEEVVARGQPHASRSPFMGPRREFITVERLILPFTGNDDNRIGFLLVALAPLDPPQT